MKKVKFRVEVKICFSTFFYRNFVTFCCQVKAVDADQGDNAKVDYSLASASAYFTVDAGSGIVRTKRLLDGAAVAYHNLVITARDRGTPRMSSQGKTMVLDSLR